MGSRSRDKGGGGSAGGPVAELSLPRFAILTAVLRLHPGPLLRYNALASVISLSRPQTKESEKSGQTESLCCHKAVHAQLRWGPNVACQRRSHERA